MRGGGGVWGSIGLREGRGLLWEPGKTPHRTGCEDKWGIFAWGVGGVVIFGESENWIHYRHAGFWAKLSKSS
jgi:hypothetical protein